MENYNWLITAVSIAAAIGARNLVRREGARWPRKIAEALVVFVVVGIAAGTASFAVRYGMQLSRQSAAREAALERVRQFPLIGRLMKDHPAFEEEITSAVRAGKDVRDIVVRGRQQFARPALLAASDASVMAAWDAQTAFLAEAQREQRHDLCAQFFASGIDDLTKLPPSSLAKFRDALSRIEDAYADGRGKPALATLPDDLVQEIARALGFSQEELDAAIALSDPTKNCDTAVRFYGSMGRLKVEYRPRLARTIIAQ